LFADVDTVKSLEWAVRTERGAGRGDFVIKHQSVEVQPDQRLSTLTSLDFEVVELFKFGSADGEVSLPLSASATVRDAAAKLAEHFAIAADRLQLSAADSILDESDRIWQFAGRVKYLLSRRKVTFTIDDERYVVDVDCDVPFSDVKHQVGREIGLDGDFTIYAGPSQVDDDMTIDDFGDESFEFRIVLAQPELSARVGLPLQPPPRPTPVAAPTTAPAPVSGDPAPSAGYPITLCLGMIPRCMTTRLPPTATLQEVEAEVVKRFELEGIDLEFVLSDLFSDETKVLEKTVTLGSLDMKKNTLMVQQKGTAAEAAAAVAGNDDQDEGGGAGSGGAALHVTVSTVKPAAGMVLYKFIAGQYEQEYSIAFPPGKTVLDARKAVAARYEGKTAADITLLFSGKALRDGFVLDRLRIGNGRITVYVRDLEGILLVTARANRDP
jgi:hypothetical protein